MWPRRDGDDARTVLLHVVLALLLVSSAPVTAPARAPVVDAASIGAVVAAYRAKTRIPGIAVAVTRGRDVIHAAGYGHNAGRDPVTDRTVMAVASLSKSVTALAVMQFVDAGRVRLDAPVRGYLPEFTMLDKRASTITVRQLLDQTSGMSDRRYRQFSGPAVQTLRERVASLRTARLAADPGNRHEYHNPNFQVAARLVEVVSGQPFDGYLRRHMFGPLGMPDSRTVDTSDDVPPGTRGHRMIAGVSVALPEPPAFGNGSGGVLSTARDWAAWLIAQHDQGRGPDGRPVVSPAAVAEMHRPSPVGSYGLGWDTGRTASGAPLIEHTGGLVTATAYQALLPSTGHGIAVLANSGSQYGDAVDLGARLVDLVEGRTVPPAPSPVPLIVIEVALLAFTIVALALGVRGVRRAGRWAARRRTVAGTVLRLAPYAMPLILLLSLHRVASVLYRGQDVSWLQTVYLYPTFTLLLAVGAVACLAVLAARVVARARPTRATAAGHATR